jgi:hypothetical protein
MSVVGSFLLEPEPHPDLDLSRIGDIGRLAKELSLIRSGGRFNSGAPE